DRRPDDDVAARNARCLEREHRSFAISRACSSPEGTRGGEPSPTRWWYGHRGATGLGLRVISDRGSAGVRDKGRGLWGRLGGGSAARAAGIRNSPPTACGQSIGLGGTG